MDVQLVVAAGNKAGQIIPITGEKFIIGRADDCHLKPRSELISRYHCAIVSEEGYVAVRDLGSKNGVYLNGERISLESELKNGDKLNVGPLEFVVQLSVGMKGAKKPKVESVGEAVVRTAEMGAGTKTDTDAAEANVADWLLGSDESDQGQETKTAEYDQAAPTVGVFVPEPSDPPKAAPEEVKIQPEAASKKNASGRDAAANLLKNFFKGGR